MCAGPMTRNDTAFMGFYAVSPDYQRIGIGRELWAKTVGRLDPSANVGLYGVPSMSNKYKKSGFTLEDSTRMLIFESEPNENDKLNIDSLRDIDELGNCGLETINSDTSELLFKKLIDYDQSVQKFSREHLLRHYLRGKDIPLTIVIVRDGHHGAQVDRKHSCCAKPTQEAIVEDETLSTNIKSSLLISANNIGEPQPRSTSPIDIPSVSSQSSVSSQQQQPQSINQEMDCLEVLGYGCIRYDNTNGGMIGPIYADSSDICEVILKNLMKSFELEAGAKYSVMALTSNKQACKILSKVGLIERDQCSRMFTKFIPVASLSKIYYVHSPNFTLF